MIYHFIQTIPEDTHILSQWIKGESVSEDDGKDQQQKVHVAALRMLACLGMAFGALWGVSLFTFVLSVFLTILWRLSTAVGMYAISHDVFIMCQNVSQEPQLLSLFRERGQEEVEDQLLHQLTDGTLIQPFWTEWVF